MAMSISDEIDVDGDAHGVEMEPIVNNKKKPNLGNKNRQLIYQKLFAKQRDDGSLPKGVFYSMLAKSSVSHFNPFHKYGIMESNHLRLAIRWPTY